MSKADKKARKASRKSKEVIANIGYRNWERNVQRVRKVVGVIDAGWLKFLRQEKGPSVPFEISVEGGTHECEFLVLTQQPPHQALSSQPTP